jgi:hypothetical protein
MLRCRSLTDTGNLRALPVQLAGVSFPERLRQAKEARCLLVRHRIHLFGRFAEWQNYTWTTPSTRRCGLWLSCRRRPEPVSEPPGVF